jgi:hypothetical protein
MSATVDPFAFRAHFLAAAEVILPGRTNYPIDKLFLEDLLPRLPPAAAPSSRQRAVGLCGWAAAGSASRRRRGVGSDVGAGARCGGAAGGGAPRDGRRGGPGPACAHRAVHSQR